MKVKFHAAARRDLTEATAFYRKRSPLAAVAFAHHVDAALTRITDAPLRYRLGEDGTREYGLPSRFPYTIVYRVETSVIVIVAVAHQGREPGYWSDRL